MRTLSALVTVSAASLFVAADAHAFGWVTHQNITEQVARQHGITDAATISLLRTESIWADTSWDTSNPSSCRYGSEDLRGTWGISEEYNPFYDDGPQTIQNGDHIFDVYDWDHGLSPTGRDCDDAQQFFSVFGAYAAPSCQYVQCTSNAQCPGQVVSSGLTPGGGAIGSNSCSACGLLGCNGTGYCKFYEDDKNCWGSCRFASPNARSVTSNGAYSGAQESLGLDRCYSGAPSWPTPSLSCTSNANCPAGSVCTNGTCSETCTSPLQMLARGAHYIEDVGSPWHTVAWANAFQPANHGAYETGYLDTKWSDATMNLTGWASSGSASWTDYDSYVRCDGWESSNTNGNCASSWCNGTTTSLASMSYYDLANDLAHITTQFQRFVNDNRGVTTCADSGVPVATYSSNYTASVNGHYTTCFQDNPWVSQWVVWYAARALSAANHKADPALFP